MALNDNDLLLINDSQNSNEAKKIKYSTLKSNINGDSGNDLQAVTDNGSTTTNGATFGSGNITLNANGSSQFTGTLTSQFAANDPAHMLFKTGTVDKGSIGLTNTDLLLGSALDNTGNISFQTKRAALGGTGIRAQLSNEGNFRIGGTLPASPNITLNADGTASFAAGKTKIFAGGTLRCATSGDTPNNGNNDGIQLNDDGTILASTSGSRGNLFVGYATGNGTETVNIKNDGSATFAGNVTCGTSPNSATESGVLIGTGGACLINRVDDGAAVAFSVREKGTENTRIDSDGSAYFAGNVTSDGTIGFNLEADNPANYTTTTVDGEEVQVYNGPVLDVKSVIQTLQQKVEERDATIATLTTRLSAIENADITDDAEHSALLTLVASLATRVTALEQGGN